MTFHLHYGSGLLPDEENFLRKSLDENVKLTLGEEIPDPPTYQMLIKGRPSREFLEAGTQLETVVIPWAGLPEPTGEMIRDFPHIAVHNLHHNAVITAETALMLLFAAAKRTITYDQTLRKHDWRMRYDTTNAVLLHGKTVLILGFGHIGQHVGRVCSGMGMRVLATKRTAQPDETLPAEIFLPDALHDLLPQADFLVITLPLTESTRALIGTEELSLLPERAILVNVGRGVIVDQQALYEALKTDRLHAAGLDVWYNYPASLDARSNTPPADVPFHELENVVMSPHRGGDVIETQNLRLQHVAVIANAAARGEALPNRVDIEAGY